jgi:hypothetical protein
MLEDLGFPMLCGDAGVAQTSKGVLRGGHWQIRCRTFDGGSPWPSRPSIRDSGSGFYDLTDIPASNTSPWSAAVQIFVQSQVPSPVPLSPISGIAVQDGFTVRLLWKYLNSATPAFPQKSRTVQIRQAGEASWTTLLTDDLSALPYFDVTDGVYALDATTQYEWRVRVTDTTDTFSEWSTSAFFWVVPQPDSAVVRHPERTIDGATLGCGTHRAFIYRKGGKVEVGEVTGLTHVDWNRVRDDVSTAKVNVRDWSVDCGNMLSLLHTWAYELVIFRDNGYSNERVWEGPITLLTFETDEVVIEAKDVFGWALRRIVKQAFNDFGTGGGDTVTSRARRIFQSVMAPDDPNVLQFLQVYSNVTDAMQYRSLPPYARTAFEEIDDMAANAGLDYTTVGRSVVFWGNKNAIGLLPEFTDSNLGSAPIVSEYGMSFANRVATGDGNGVYGEATHLDENGQDLDYGLVEMLNSTYASEAGDETGTYTQESLNDLIESFEEFSERSIASRYPPPTVVRIPDNTTINPNTVISIQQLVPGVIIPLRSTGTLREIRANQKLDKVTVVEEAGNETISIILSPFGQEDIVVEESPV